MKVRDHSSVLIATKGLVRMEICRSIFAFTLDTDHIRVRFVIENLQPHLNIDFIQNGIKEKNLGCANFVLKHFCTKKVGQHICVDTEEIVLLFVNLSFVKRRLPNYGR